MPFVTVSKTLAVGLLAASFAGIGHTKSTEVVYYGDYETGVGGGRIVAWNDSTLRARVTDAAGVRTGLYTGAVGQRVITYDVPVVAQVSRYDSDCMDVVEVQRRTTQLAERQLSGTSRKGKMHWESRGSDTHLTGCKAGYVLPFAEQWASNASDYLAMNALPVQRSLVEGDRWAGLVEGQRDAASYPDSTFHMPQQTAVVATGGNTMQMASGSKLGASVGADGWLRLMLPGGTERVFKRVAVKVQTGAETWLMGDRADGKLQWVDVIRMVAPQAAATFGTAKASARVWLKKDPAFSREYRLWPDGAGLMVDDSVLPDPGHIEWPLTWTYAPQAIHIFRTTTDIQRDRLWIPLARFGKTQWMLESEQYTRVSTGEVTVLIAPRVASYRDMGAATPPALTLRP